MKDLDERITEYAACFDEAPFPCGVVEIIRNIDSTPANLVLRYANNALAAVLEYPCGSLLNQPVCDIFPTLSQSWLSFYNDIAFGGGEKKKTVFLPGLGRYLSIHAFNPCEGASVFLMLDVTDEKKTELEYITKLDEQKRLVEKRYARSLAMRDQANRESIGSFYLNLSKNLYGDGHTPVNQIQKSQNKTVDVFFSGYYAHCVESEHYNEFKAVFNRENLLRCFREGQVFVSQEHRFLADEQRSVWVKTSVYMVQNPDTGDIEALLWTNNIHEEKTIRDIFERFGEIEYDYIALVDVKTQELRVVKKRRTIKGLPQQPCNYGKTVRELIPLYAIEGQADELMAQMSLSSICTELEKRDTHTLSYSVRRPEGGILRKKWKYTYLDNTRRTIAFTCSDITEIYNADVDAVTNIYNRTMFTQKARRMLDDMPDTRFVLVRCDIDRFRVYNDIYGVAEGDRLLMTIASALRRVPLHPCVFGHIEADHFACLGPAAVVNRIPGNAELAGYLRKLQPDFDFKLRFGIYAIEDPTIDINMMLDRALLALRSCKGKFDEYVALYDESMRASLLLEQELLGDMSAALENGEFVIYLQPQFNYVKNELVGAEAVVRWFHPVKGLLQPASFIHIFEKSGCITQLDLYVCECCCRLLRKWIDSGLHPVPLSANISRIDLYNPHLCETLCGLVQKYDLSCSSLRLEITESAYMDNPKQLIGAIEQLHKKGFLIEMDDFGSGYSSLNSLKDMPVDVIKLDLNFLTSSGDTGKSGIILNSIVRMAHWLNLEIIAEGVETKNQADYLKTIGCELIQGYLYAAPMSADEFSALLRESKAGKFSGSGIVSDFFDEREFWNPDVQATIVFNKFIGPAGIVEYRNGILEATQFNDKFFESTHISRSLFQSFSRNLLEAVLPEDKNSVIKVMESAKDSDNEIECESRWLRSNGEVLWLKIRVQQIAKSVSRCAFYVSIENETEHKHLLQRKSELENQLKALTRSIPRRFLRLEISDGVRVSMAGEMTAEALGFTLDEYLELFGRNFFQAIHPEDRAHLTAELAALKDEPDGVVDVRFRHVCRDKSYRMEKLSGIVFQKENGFCGINAVLIDLDGQAGMEHQSDTKEHRPIKQKIGDDFL